MDLVKNNRMLSLLGQRGTFGTVLHDAAATDDRIIALSADLTRTSGLERFAADYPDRFINVGIAEEYAVAVAAGLADKGKIPFVTTFSNFAAQRANEFVRHFMAYMNCNVKLVGLSSGFAMELFGNTHYGLEDVAVLRSFPNIEILSPCDCLELAKCIEYCISHTGPVYLRLSGRMNNPIVNKADYEFTVGKGIRLFEGRDAVVFATGSMVFPAVRASKKLAEEGIGVTVVNMHTIKPFDAGIVRECREFPLIMTVEEHSVTGGLGSAVSEVLAEYRSHGRLIRLGTGDSYLKAGRYEYMLEKHGLTAENITEIIKMNIEQES